METFRLVTIGIMWIAISAYRPQFLWRQWRKGSRLFREVGAKEMTTFNAYHGKKLLNPLELRERLTQVQEELRLLKEKLKKAEDALWICHDNGSPAARRYFGRDV